MSEELIPHVSDKTLKVPASRSSESDLHGEARPGENENGFKEALHTHSQRQQKLCWQDSGQNRSITSPSRTSGPRAASEEDQAIPAPSLRPVGTGTQTKRSLEDLPQDVWPV